MQHGRLKLKLVGIVGLGLVSHSAAAQAGAVSSVTPSLHVLVGSETPEGTSAYETEVYRVDAQRGDLTLIYNLGTPGVDFIRPDFEARRLIVATPGLRPTYLHVINMDDVANVVTVPLGFGGLPASAWEPPLGAQRQDSDYISIVSKTLIDRPGIGGHWLALRLVGKLGRLMVGFPVDSKAHWEILTPDAIAHARIQGTFGVLSQSSGADSDGLAATAREKRIVVAGLDIGIPAPDEVTNDKDGWGLVGFDGRAAVMCRSKDSSSAGDGVSRMYVWGAGTDGWKTFSVPGSLPRVKMIDSWIMGLASSREPNAARPMAGGGQRSRRESPGASSRRQLEQIPADKEADRGAPAGRVATDVLFRHSDAYYPGILF